MKIDSYAVSMASTSVSVKSHTVTQQAVITNGANSGAAHVIGNGQAAALLALSPEAQEQLQEQLSNNQQPANNEVTRAEQSRQFMGISLSDEQRAKILMIEQLYERLTGRKNPFSVRRMFSNTNTQHMQHIQHTQHTQFTQHIQQQQLNLMPGIGDQNIQQMNLSFQRTETYYEYQEMSFQAAGIIKTADGRQIHLDMNVFMSHEFYTSNSTSIDIALQLGRLADPLVVSFDGLLPSFTQDRYEFDLLIGDDLQNIFMPVNGSGFLAFDKHGDGVINCGSQLFGAHTGCGFTELAAHDSDGNGWIDEGDAIFEHLRIMFVDKDSGEFMLLTLKEAGIGAIFLGHVNSNYEINSAQHETQGIIRKSGFFLYENGNSGHIHHIDLTY
ncbi:MAG: hypothetical protein FWE57_12085 [Chitinispirillia bacterium]|nr:hypothetical protein [Chitinispirillia bacterium]